VRPYEDGPIYPPYDVTSWSLPLHMGVELVEAETPIRAALTPIDQPLWPDTSVPMGDNGYLLSHAHDTVYTAMNRLLAQGKRVYWLLEDDGNGRRGDIYLPNGAVPQAELARLASLPGSPATDIEIDALLARLADLDQATAAAVARRADVRVRVVD